MPAILSAFQDRVLHALFEAGLGERHYYLSGGTALAEYHLQHRLSDDLDLFSRDGRVLHDDIAWIEETLKALGLEVEVQKVARDHGRLYVGEEKLKLDIVNDTPVRLDVSLVKAGVVVDSLLDIAANKIGAISDRLEAKDFVDLYYLLTRTNWTVEYLLAQAVLKEAKFEEQWGQLEFAAQLTRVKEVPLDKVRQLRPVPVEEIVYRIDEEAQALLQRLRPGS